MQQRRSVEGFKVVAAVVIVKQEASRTVQTLVGLNICNSFGGHGEAGRVWVGNGKCCC
jgi:hypothetical protein